MPTTDAILVKERLYDGQGRARVTTVTVPKGSQALHWSGLEFEPALVADPTGQNPALQGGALTGEIEAWVNPQSFAQDDDPLYAYRGEYLEDDPTGRKQQRTRPGTQFNSASEHATQYSVGSWKSGAGNAVNTALSLTSAQQASLLRLASRSTNLGSLGVGVVSEAASFSGDTTIQLAYGESDSNLCLLSTTTRQPGVVITSGAATAMATEARTLPKYFGQSNNRTDYLVTRRRDAAGHVLCRQSPDAGTENRYYDGAGRLRFLQNADQAAVNGQGVVIYFLYDALNRVVEAGFFDSGWELDTFGALCDDLSSTPQPDGSTVMRSLSYDVPPTGSDTNGLGRLVQQQSQQTAAGDPTSVDSGASVTTSYSYDPRGRVTAVEVNTRNTTYRTTYAYDRRDRIVQIAYHDGFVVSYQYNAQGLVSTVAFGGDTIFYRYTADGKIAGKRLLGGRINVSMTYGNSLSQLTAIDYTDSGGDTLFSESLSYDENGDYQNGKIQSATVTFGTAVSATTASYSYSYQYDIFGRLKSAKGESANDSSLPTAWPISNITYDNNGNKQSFTDGSTSYTLSYSDGTDQLHDVDSGTACTYSSGGLMRQTAAGVSLDYDLLTPLPVKATLDGSAVVFGYDGSGRRVFKQVGGSSTTYVRGRGAWPLSEVDQDGNVTRYVYGPDGLQAICHADRAAVYVLSDHLGSARVLYDTSDDTVADYYIYNAYGTVVEGQKTTLCRYLFTGQEWDDEIGLYNFHARQYDPALSVFLTPDPDHQFASAYNYAGNDPINHIDPTGRFEGEDVGEGSARSEPAESGNASPVDNGNHGMDQWDEDAEDDEDSDVGDRDIWGEDDFEDEDYGDWDLDDGEERKRERPEPVEEYAGEPDQLERNAKADGPQNVAREEDPSLPSAAPTSVPPLQRLRPMQNRTYLARARLSEWLVAREHDAVIWVSKDPHPSTKLIHEAKHVRQQR